MWPEYHANRLLTHDGLKDVFHPRGAWMNKFVVKQPNSHCLRNNGDWNVFYLDVYEAKAALLSFHPTQAATLGSNFNNDGSAGCIHGKMKVLSERWTPTGREL
jgi:hypothetical protein